jgi:RNA polymerase sigma-70 factor, ECF subfamily
MAHNRSGTEIAGLGTIESQVAVMRNRKLETPMPLAIAQSESLAVGTSSRELFENLIRRTNKQAFSLAYRLTGNAAEAEDLCQESFVRAFRFFDKYDRSLPFASWLYRIMTNAHIDLVRRKGRLRTTSLEQGGQDGSTTWDLPDAKSSPDREMMQQSLDAPVQNGLMAMTAEFRTAVLLADVEGLAYEEIADVMHTSVGTVRSRIHRGRKQLRSYLLKHAPQSYRSYNDEL